MIIRALSATALLFTVFATELPAQQVAKMDEPLPTKPFAKLAASMSAMQDSIIAYGRRQLGTPYRLGSKTPGKAFDCSGLVQYVMEHFDIRLPRTSREMAQMGTPVERKIDALKPGDLLTFGNSKRITHVGIYVGEGKFLHASSSKGKRYVTETTLRPEGGWWKGARRILTASDEAEQTASNGSSNDNSSSGRKSTL